MAAYLAAGGYGWSIGGRAQWRQELAAGLGAGGGRLEHRRKMAGWMLLLGGMSGSGSSQQHRILAIDDEAGFLGFLKSVLECQGYRVQTVSSPQEAIKLYETQWRDFDLVLLDLWLPSMTGDIVFDELQRLNPDVRVVLLTGYEESVPYEMFHKGLRGSLRKPFSLTDLARKVEDAMSTPSASPTASPSAA